MDAVAWNVSVEHSFVTGVGRYWIGTIQRVNSIAAAMTMMTNMMRSTINDNVYRYIHANLIYT